ncbi:rhodanese-related sulfurtransferase [Aliiruegeria haliotis]|uniref:Rhodanese-related sulfurtransferase n=1 Tax=Aliiruegeria haliotis TaxID=1280846 RepID=A0A2T0RSZ2_9RHOB|nr:rhodanese-like domain-containing protein [Aliiruegeria haliotis]PRY24262.1 rhodanese-related sulfurtransferase [Aliiruegeria haliotis]
MFALLNPFAAGADKIAPAAAVAMVKSGEAVLIDVREPAEFAQSRADGAVNIPVSQLSWMGDPSSADSAVALTTGKPVILYCASGARSGMAGKLLRKRGHKTVYNLGSLNEWRNGGGRVLG